MVLGVPIAQLLLFGYAINTDPRNLPTAIIAADRSEFTRSYIAAMKTTGYFDIVGELPDEEAGRVALARGDVQFVLNIPADFTRELLRGERPALLLEADATDPSAMATAIGSCSSSCPRSPGRICAARSPRCRAARPPSRCGCTSCTTRKESRSATSCPA